MWVVDGGPLGCHCRRLSFRLVLRCRYPVTTYGVGRWVVKPTAVLLFPLPVLPWNTVHMYSVLNTYPLKVPCGLPGTANQEHGVWSSIHYGVQWRIHLSPDRVFIRLQPTNNANKTRKINKHGWQEWMNKMNEGIQRSSSWLTSMALYFFFYIVLVRLAVRIGREHRQRRESPGIRFDPGQNQNNWSCTELQLVVDIVVYALRME